MEGISDLFPGWFTDIHDYHFVDRLDSDPGREWEKAVVGFLNTCGGELLVGISDPRGTLRGMGRKGLEAQREILRRWISRSLVPCPPRGCFSYCYPSYQKEGNELYLMKVAVREGPFLPYALKEEEGEAAYLRQERWTKRASVADFRAIVSSFPRDPFDSGKTDVLFDPSDFQRLFSFFQEQNGFPLGEETLEGLSFFDEARCLRRGALLFRDGCRSPETLVSCRRWKGVDPALSVLIRREERRGDLLGQFDFLRGFIEENSCIGLEKLDDGNREIRSYPVQAALEAAGNAILQRDYRIEGAAIELDIYDDRLVLASPGFPLGCSGTFMEEDLLSFAARTRNPLIAHILSLCRLSEKDRLPFANTIECYKDAGCGKRPSWNVIDGSFSLVLPDLLYAGPGFLSLHRPLSFVPLPGEGSTTARFVPIVMDPQGGPSRLPRQSGYRGAPTSITRSSPPWPGMATLSISEMDTLRTGIS